MHMIIYAYMYILIILFNLVREDFSVLNKSRLVCTNLKKTVTADFERFKKNGEENLGD